MAVKNYLNPEVIEEAGTSWEEISAIEEDFKKKSTSYEQDVQAVSNILLKASGVHSVRYRVKDSMHLMEKVVRKRHEDKTRIITPDNYEQEITDLAGVRVLHLFKSDWQRIHRFITNTWELHENPTAYFREGDSEAVLDMYRKQNCGVKQHTAGYRSVHYIIKTSLTRAKRLIEIQVRTLFEEGWSEVDHKLRYPNFSDNPLTNNLLLILNRLAGSADEMSSFVKELHSHLRTSKLEVERSQHEHKEQVAQMQKVIDELHLSAQDKSKLEGAAKSLGENLRFDYVINHNAMWQNLVATGFLDKLPSPADFDPTLGPSILLTGLERALQGLPKPATDQEPPSNKQDEAPSTSAE